MDENLIPYAIVTAVAAFFGALGLGVSQWMSAGLKSSTRKVFHLLLSGILWPFRWAVTTIKEWHRVSGYRYRHITWDDLPDESKLAVHVQDLSDLAQRLIGWEHLSQEAKDAVSFQDLSEEARISIKVNDLPRDEKLILLDKLIFPPLHVAKHEGALSLFDDNNSITLSETVQISVAQALDYSQVHQDRVQISFNIAFTNPGADFQLPMGSMIAITGGRWAVQGTIRYRTRTNSSTQTVTVWVTFLIFDNLTLFAPSD